MSDRISTLDELLSDPMVLLVMERDRVRPEQVRLLLERARRPAADEPSVPPAHVVAKTCLQQWLGR
ncbi:hypothetical protein NLY43_02345 [Mesorhizobium sp. C416B]|uniref:hypothetical protein n=1 Tax=unclassified Mesorhizobium TaxID=325217 RepID=UPI0003CEC8FD|nr:MULTISPECIES: hypothetical protein [unclassified Mesorhizobium]ESX47439.1 hypothetical protein X762_16750 [Mesorhizobium sp. LSHC426A00]ESX50665.1 hypothetical protein X761_25355 [Mesorhizobium sp. LSHC424B00]ESX66207.1 hypothetical protein X758_27220 [Mesorhizobium sp. LSHC416B00]ESY03788.1 hypothetical protein X753_22535 [Mesorhizobium sp. LNJC399B00]ESY26569.1 hypothetical protein X749_26640 [Mesorhizobium sp. LNJC391B00]